MFTAAGTRTLDGELARREGVGTEGGCGGKFLCSEVARWREGSLAGGQRTRQEKEGQKEGWREEGHDRTKEKEGRRV